MNHSFSRQGNGHTELKQTKNSLISRETFQGSLTDVMRSGYAYCEMIVEEGGPLDFIHKEVNACYEKMICLENIAGRKASEVFPVIDKSFQKFIEKQARVAETGISDRFEIYMDSLQLWLDISVCSPQKGYFVSMIDNITERKQVEGALRESELRFRKLFQEHSAIMIVIEPDTGRIIDANFAAADFYGWSIKELRRMYVQEINTLPPEEVKKEMEKSCSLAQNYFVFRHRRSDGSIRDVDVFSNKVKVAGKALLYSIIHDVTERTRYEFFATFRLHLIQLAETSSVRELLQTALAEAQRLTQSTIGFVFFLPEDQRSLFLQLCTANSFKKRYHVDGMGEEVLLESAGVWADAVRERRSVIHNDCSTLPYGNSIPDCDLQVKRELVVPVIRDDRVVAIMGIGNKAGEYDESDVKWVDILANLTWDIVAKKIAEDEREKLHNQLYHSQKMDMVCQLAAGLAHEINNPLNFIAINFANIQEAVSDLKTMVKEYQTVTKKLEEGTLSPFDLQKLSQKEAELALDTLVNDIPEILAESQRGFNRITTIINGIRNLSYQDALDKKIDFDINKAIIDILALTRHEYRLCANIKTAFGILPPLQCNPEQIKQVLFNLIVNSIHAIQSQRRSSNGIISIHTWCDRTHVFCSIIDDGPGIPEAIRKSIFNPFFTTKSPGKGTGLGLSISWDIIVTKHNGTLSVETPAEGGTVFTFSLPQQTRLN